MILRIRADRPIWPLVVLFFVLALSACRYDFPLTATPTRKVEPGLLGNWVSDDGKEQMRVRRLDDSVYIVYYDGDLFRAYHSDLSDVPLVSVQDLNSPERKYACVIWKLSDDGQKLQLRALNNKIVPGEIHDSTGMVEFLKKKLKDPDLFGEAIEFRKEK